MARRGRFGHRPTSGGNLTALIASLYQQQRAAEDRVMFDAYQNGGRGLDGQPVTDQKMRSYIAQRRDSIGKGDPLYQEWNNRLIQLDFKIGEEKVGLAYKQGRVGAGAVAAYYREQLSKIPQDSEFYRDVAGRAAEWAKAAGNAARSAARRRLTKALDAKSRQITKTWENYSGLVGYLTNAARRAGLISGNQELTDADATDLEAFLKNGVAGPHGTTITFADWQHATVASYKAFDDAIALNKQLGRGTKTLQKQKASFLTDNLVKVNTIDDRAKYEVARDAFQKAVADAQGDPRAVLEAAQTYANQLTGILNTAKKGTGLANENEADFIGGLTNEITALTTGKASGASVYDLYTGGENNDLAETAGDIQKANADVQALANGTAIYGQDEYGGGFKVIPLPPAAALDSTGNMGLDKSYQKAVIDIDGVPTQVMLKGLPVQAKGLVNPDGVAVTTADDGHGHLIDISTMTPEQIGNLLAQGYKTTDAKTVGYVFTNGDKTTYGVVQSDGSIAYTTNNPFGTNAVAGQNGVGLFVGAALGPDNKTVQPLVPNYSLVGATSVIADESITPKDLLNLASVSDAGTAAILTAEADKRTKAAQAEADYMARAKGKGGTDSQGLPIYGNILADSLQKTQDLLKSINPRINEATGFDIQPPPSLPPLSSFSPASIPSTTPSVNPSTGFTMPTAPTPTANATGAKASGGKDDTYTPPPGSGGAAVGGAAADIMNKLTKPGSGGAAVGAASADLINKLTKPTSGGKGLKAL